MMKRETKNTLAQNLKGYFFEKLALQLTLWIISKIMSRHMRIRIVTSNPKAAEFSLTPKSSLLFGSATIKYMYTMLIMKRKLFQ